MEARRHIAIALIVMLVFVGYYLWCEYTTAGAFGFPLDDAWIHAQFARNLALGNGFSYNPGVSVSGSTAPLWTLVMGTGYLIGGDAVFAAKLLGVLFLSLSVYFVYMLVRMISGDSREALFSAVLVGSLPRLIWASLSGMEVTLAVTLSLAGIVAHVLYSTPGDKRQYISTVALGLATLARPECAVFFVAAILDRVFSNTLIRWRELTARSWLLPTAVHIVLFLLIVFPFLLFSKKFGIGLLPNTAYAKAIHWNAGMIAAFTNHNGAELLRSLTVRPLNYYLSFMHESLNNNPLLSMFAGLGALRMVFMLPFTEGSRHRSFIIPLSILLFPLALGVVLPFGGADFQRGRYIAPIAPLMLIMGTIGMYAAASYASRVLAEAKFMGRPARIAVERALIWGFMVIALSGQVANGVYYGRAYGVEVANIEEMQVTLGRWIDLTLPMDATVATNDIGAIAYFSQREILDTCGLISPEVLAYMKPGVSRESAVLSFLKERKPDYAVLFPNWYPEMVKGEAIFEPVYRVVLENNMVCGGPEMVVYRLHWDALDSRDAENVAKQEDERAARLRNGSGEPSGDLP